jgi:hypothetical protein
MQGELRHAFLQRADIQGRRRSFVSCFTDLPVRTMRDAPRY